MRKRKSENQKEADKKGKERMKRYEEAKEFPQKVDRSTLSDDEKIMKYWSKQGSGDWELLEYVYKVKKK